MGENDRREVFHALGCEATSGRCISNTENADRIHSGSHRDRALRACGVYRRYARRNGATNQGIAREVNAFEHRPAFSISQRYAVRDMFRADIMELKNHLFSFGAHGKHHAWTE